MIRNAAQFGRMVREHRRSSGLTQDELAARCGVARRFIIQLEAGKPTCQLGKALTVAVEVGFRLEDVGPSPAPATLPNDTDVDDPLASLPRF